ncbi:MAG: DUF370 domain-containing protein [Oscillospiraceae bacterium]|jgi:hypothetical protein|nr:DUF370 domain-containing protein [Oscillospiraceae bacterium]
MFLYLERDEVVRESEIVGIFDLDNASWSHKTREYLSASEKSGRLKNLSDGLPRTLIVTTGRDYLTALTGARAAARRIPAGAADGVYTLYTVLDYDITGGPYGGEH